MRKMRHKIFLCILFLSTGSTLLSAPVLRVGIITDTHVTDDKNSCVLLEKALRLFKKQKADMVINAGDIADSYNVRAYRNYRETVSKIYRGEKPREIFVYANHDWIGRKSTPVRQVFQDVKKHLEIPNAPYDTVKYKGYTFVIVPQFADMARYKNMLDKAVKDNPGKPVFVVDHVPPADTVFATDGLSGERRKLLDHYPSVILLCGHKHNTLASELAIWQGNFTVVHAGCLQKWRLFLTGSPWWIQKSSMVLFMEVYKDRLLFRRYDCLTGKEYKPDAPWIIPLPFDKNTAPYAPVLRSRTATAPEFPQNAKLVFAPGKKFAVFSFPHARHANGVYRYKTEIFHLKGKKKILSARRDQPGNFTDLNVTQTQISLNNGYFQAGERYSVRVTPMNFQDKEGRSLEIEFTFPAEKKYKICFESRDPAVDCKVFEGAAGEKRLTPDPEGFFTIPENRIIRLVFPGNIWPGKAWTPYRFTLEMQLKDSSSRTRLMELRNLDPRDAATGRILLPGGDAGNLRYIFYHSKREDDYNYQLFLLPGSKGKVRFSYVKSERLDSPVTPRSVK